MKLSIVIPAYNEVANIRFTINELLSAIEVVLEAANTQIIVVDDHSSDNTFEAVKNINDARVICIRLSRRSGSHIAIRAGLRISESDAVLFISADGQEDISCIEAMLSKYRKGAKIIWALRKDRKDEPWHARKTARIFYTLLNWFDKDKLCVDELYRADFCLLDREVVNAVNSCNEKNTSIFGLISWLGFEQDFVEYQRKLRRHGRSKWNFGRRLNLAIDWIVAFSGLPLRLMSIIGTIVASFGFLYAIFIIFNMITGNPPEGWTSTMVVILVVGGVQMMMMGIIGEYLWRNIEESRNRPLYFVEKDTDKRNNT